MKLKNVKVGQLVKVKKSAQRNHNRIGKIGEIIDVEVDGGELTVHIEFNEKDKFCCYCDWFNHNDLKMVKGNTND